MFFEKSAKRAALLGVMGLGTGLFAMSAQADWQGKGELGLVLARGNTESKTITAKADMTTTVDPWTHLIGFSVLRSSSSDVVTGDRYELHGQSDYKLTERSYALGSLRYENDQFSSYRYQAVATVGYGYKIYDTDATKLATEFGVGYRRAEDRITQETEGNVIARIGVNFAHKLTATSDVYDKFLVESGSNNTFVQNEVGIKVAMNSSLALSVAHLIRYNSTVVAPTQNADQLLTANLVFSF